MKVSLEHLAHLARLELSPEEKAEYEASLAAILEAFSILREAPVDHLEPLFSVGPASLRLRDDEVQPPPGREVMLQDVPDRFQHYIRVPSPLAEVRKRQ